jgi:hypothetical protein
METKKTIAVLIRDMPIKLHAKLIKAGKESRAKLKGEILNRLERSFEE